MTRGTRSPDRRTEIGGKAAALEAAAAAGLPVPGFVAVTVADVAALVAGAPGVSAARRRVEAAAADLGADRFAVRSSAQAEDGTRSFAGQFDTRLDVPPDEVLAAVVAVASPAVRARVSSYERATGAHAGRLAVLVQLMVPGRWSGVAFSRDPLTYQPEVLVEAVAGSGEELVGGRRTPTRARFRRPDPHARSAGSDRSGGLPRTDLELREAVPDPVLAEAAALALRCEEAFGCPQDVEWTHDGESMHLLQSRPLTGFADAEVYSDTWSAEVWPGLITPLVFDVGDTAVNAAWGRILTSVAGPVDVDWRRMAGLAASRVYFNETLLGEVLARAGLPENTLEGVVRGERPRLRDGSWQRLVLSTGRLTRFLVGNTSWLDRVDRDLPPLATRVQQVTEEVSRAGATALAALLPELLVVLEDAAHLSALTTMSMGLRAQYARLATRVLTGSAAAPTLATAGFGTAPLRALERVSAAVVALSDAQRDVVATGDPDRIEHELRTSPAGRVALAAMADLLRRWGHVADVNTDFATPAWRDDPGRLWRLAVPTEKDTRTAARVRDPGRSTLLEQPEPTLTDERGTGAGGRSVRAGVLARRHASVRAFVEARDEVNDVLARAYDAWRQAARAAGAALSPDVLPDPGLVHFLDLAELEAALRGRPLAGLGDVAAERAGQWESDHGLAPPHRLWALRLPERSRMRPGAHAGPPGGDGVLRGVPASPGRVRALARVVRRASDGDRLRPGEVLVADHADIGWTPLFTVAAAVVTGTGGALSHAAVVARELGIPAVVGLEDATHLIGDGVEIRVDGAEGTVRIVGSTQPGSAGAEDGRMP